MNFSKPKYFAVKENGSFSLNVENNLNSSLYMSDTPEKARQRYIDLRESEPDYIAEVRFHTYGFETKLKLSEVK